MLITVYDNESFIRKCTLPHYTSFIYNKRLYSVGSFELTLKNFEGDVGDLLLYDDFCGIIRRMIYTDYGVMIYGYDLKALFSQRVFEGELTYENKTAEYILHDIAVKYLGTDSRRITGIDIPEISNTGETIETYTFQKGSCVSEALSSFCQSNQIGYDLIFDETNIRFCTIKPRINSDLIFSRRKHNIENVQYIKGEYDFVNVIYYTDENEDIRTDGAASGINRFESYTEKAEDMENYKKEHSREETVKGTPVNCKYNIDYRLGDVMTVVSGDIMTTKTITEIECAIEHSKKTITPTFGTEKENPIRKLIKG